MKNLLLSAFDFVLLAIYNYIANSSHFGKCFREKTGNRLRPTQRNILWNRQSLFASNQANDCKNVPCRTQTACRMRPKPGCCLEGYFALFRRKVVIVSCSIRLSLYNLIIILKQIQHIIQVHFFPDMYLIFRLCHVI